MHVRNMQRILVYPNNMYTVQMALQFELWEILISIFFSIPLSRDPIIIICHIEGKLKRASHAILIRFILSSTWFHHNPYLPDSWIITKKSSIARQRKKNHVQFTSNSCIELKVEQRSAQKCLWDDKNDANSVVLRKLVPKLTKKRILCVFLLNGRRKVIRVERIGCD